MTWHPSEEEERKKVSSFSFNDPMQKLSLALLYVGCFRIGGCWVGKPCHAMPFKKEEEEEEERIAIFSSPILPSFLPISKPLQTEIAGNWAQYSWFHEQNLERRIRVKHFFPLSLSFFMTSRITICLQRRCWCSFLYVFVFLSRSPAMGRMQAAPEARKPIFLPRCV